MIRSFVFLFLLTIGFSSSAQTDSSHLRISLITCGVGEEVWETFGHTALRVTDSVAGTDNVYNYGTFNGYEEGFELKFMRGKLLYYVSYYPYYLFLKEYEEAHRSVQEQVLLLDGKNKEHIYEFLKWNSTEEYKSYKYDFLFDNCATRIRDVFPRTFGKYFRFGKTLPSGSKLTFRNIINQYLYRNHFERFGINLLLGSQIDSVMTNEDIMFLPDYLRDGIGNATVKGQKVAAAPVTILPGSPHLPAGINAAFIFMLILGGATIFLQVFRSESKAGRFMGNFVLFVSGFVGCFILVMWLGTDHQGCRNNLNILWALPTNIFIAFGRKKNKDKYAVIAILLLLVSLVLHILRVQELPLMELWPLLLALLVTYGMIYRRNKLKMY